MKIIDLLKKTVEDTEKIIKTEKRIEKERKEKKESKKQVVND